MVVLEQEVLMNCFKVRFDYFSGFLVLLNFDVFEMFKKVKFDGCICDVYLDCCGCKIEVFGFMCDYYLYVLGLRMVSYFLYELVEWLMDMFLVKGKFVF